MNPELSNIPPRAAPRDGWGRSPRYLRVSITDRCNFNCVYCGDTDRRQYIPHENVLRYESMIRFADIARKFGVGKIRITGGEPFARKNCMEFLASLRRKFPDMSLSVTTNGSLLEPYINDLAKLKLISINISLDSFDADVFAKITGVDALAAVLKNIDALLGAGQHVKLNAVAMRGITDTRFGDFMHAVKTMPIDMRFIEFMPMGNGAIKDETGALSAGELLEMARSYADLSPIIAEDGFAGPARMRAVKGGKGRIGFISAMSDHFCATCNRLRLTADGKLRLCLFGEKEYNFGPMLKRASAAAIERALGNVWRRKPLGCEILEHRAGNPASSRRMSAIGG